MRLITAHDLQGQLARWAVQQHPYKAPPGLLSVVAELGRCAQQFIDGDPALPMRWFKSQEDLEAWLVLAIGQNADVLSWNQPRSGPEDDFIDLYALFRNIASSVWREAAEFEKSDAA